MIVPHPRPKPQGQHPRARDLVTEAKQKKRKAQQTATEALMQPGGLKHILDISTGQENPGFCDAFVVHVSDDFCEATLEEDDTEKLTHLSAIPGVYWLVASLNDQLYFKQEPGENGAANNKQLVAGNQQLVNQLMKSCHLINEDRFLMRIIPTRAKCPVR